MGRLQLALDRVDACAIPPERTRIITAEAYREETARQLPSLSSDRIVGEPVGRDTAPCVGLGAALPNFRETDPSKIAVGFGGTLNLVAGLGLLVLTLCLLALPWHWEMRGLSEPHPERVSLWLIGSAATVGVAVGTLAVLLPLRLGIQRLRAMEF